jgi:hypothetical protein
MKFQRDETLNAKAVSAPFPASHRSPRRSRVPDARRKSPRGLGVRWVKGEGTHRFELRTTSLHSKQQLEMGSATVPVAPVDVSSTGPRRCKLHETRCCFRGRSVFGATPKTAGATPALPETNGSVPSQNES